MAVNYNKLKEIYQVSTADGVDYGKKTLSEFVDAFVANEPQKQQAVLNYYIERYAPVDADGNPYTLESLSQEIGKLDESTFQSTPFATTDLVKPTGQITGSATPLADAMQNQQSSLIRNPETGLYERNKDFGLNTRQADKHIHESVLKQQFSTPTHLPQPKPIATSGINKQRFVINTLPEVGAKDATEFGNLLSNMLFDSADENDRQIAANIIDLRRKQEAGVKDKNTAEEYNYYASIADENMVQRIKEYQAQQAREDELKLSNNISSQKKIFEKEYNRLKSRTSGAQFHAAHMGYNPSTGSDQQAIKESAYYANAIRRLNNAESIIERNKKDMNAGEQLLEGAKDAIDIDLFTLGLEDLFADATLLRVLEKADSNFEQLSDGEHALLTSAIVEQATEAIDNSGNWYNIGRGFVETMPYMLEFSLSTLLAKGLLKGATRKVANYLMRSGVKAGSKVTRPLAKGAIRNATKFGAGLTNAAMIATAQLPFQLSIYSDFTERNIGELDTSKTNRAGQLQYKGREHVDAGTAAMQSFQSGLITNMVERFGGDVIAQLGGLIPRGLGKGLSKLTGKEVKSPMWWRSMKQSIKDRGWGQFIQAAGYQGSPTEFFEELLEQSLNALIVGDQSLDEVWSTDNIATTAGVTLLTSAFMGSATGVLNIYDRKRINEYFIASEKAATERFTPEQINSLRELVDMPPAQFNSWVAAVNQEMKRIMQEEPSEVNAQRLESLAAQRDYVVSGQLYNAYIGGLRDRIQPQVDQAQQAINNNAHQDSGYTIRVNYQGNTGYLVGGSVDMAQEMPNLTGSLYTIVFDTPNGRSRLSNIPAERIDVIEAVPTQTVIDAGVNNIYAMLEQDEAAQIIQAQGQEQTQEQEQQAPSQEQSLPQEQVQETPTQEQSLPQEQPASSPSTTTQVQDMTDDEFDTHVDTLQPQEAINAIATRRSTEDAEQYAQWRKQNLIKQRDKAQKQLTARVKPFDPTMYETYAQVRQAQAKYNQEQEKRKAEAQAIIDDANAQLSQIEQFLIERNKQLAQEREAENPLRNGIAPAIEKLPVNTLEDYIARYIGLGGKLRSSAQYTNGLMRELGFTPGSQEHRELLSILNNTDGLTPEELSQHIAENIEPEYAHLIAGRDVQDIRNAIIDVIASGVTSPRKAYNYIAESTEKRTSEEKRYYEQIESQDQIDQDVEQAIRLYEEELLSSSTPEDLQALDDMSGEYYDELLQVTQTIDEILNDYDTATTATTHRENQQGATTTTIQPSSPRSNQTFVARDSERTAGEATATPQQADTRTTRQDDVTPDERITERVNSWLETLNAPIKVITRFDEIQNEEAKANILAGNRTPGWYEVDGTIYLYMPHLTSPQDVDKTILHEVVAHYGVRKLFKTQEQVDNFYDRVWSHMSAGEKQYFIQYVEGNINNTHDRQAAADEYIAFLAENSNFGVREQSIWQRIVSYIRNALIRNGVKLSLDKSDIATLLKESLKQLSKTEQQTTQEQPSSPSSALSPLQEQPQAQAQPLSPSSALSPLQEQESPLQEQPQVQPQAQPIGEQIQAAEAEVNTNPTEAQKEAGNYKKGHVQIGTFNVTIEQPKGSVRSGVDADGNKWETEMKNTYGYIRGTEGVDGDHIDVFLSDDIDGWDGRKVFVVDQRNADGSFDEHKVMLGFNDINDAEAAYMSNYEEGWQGLGAITGVSIEEFEKWIASSHRKTKAFAEYKTVKTTEGQSTPADAQPSSPSSALLSLQEQAQAQPIGDQVSDQVSDQDNAPAQSNINGAGERGEEIIAEKLEQEKKQRETEQEAFERLRKEAEERNKERIKKIPLPRKLVEAYKNGDADAVKAWEKQWEEYLQTLVPMDMHLVDGTISQSKERKSLRTVKNDKGRNVIDKESEEYKAWNYIESSLKKRKKQLDELMSDEDRRGLDIIKRGFNGELQAADDLTNTDEDTRFRSIRPDESLLDYARQAAKATTRFRIADNEQTATLNAKQPKSTQPLVAIENDIEGVSQSNEGIETRFRVSRRNKETIENWLNKRTDLTDAERNAFYTYIENEEPVKQLAMGKWFAQGAIRLPEDQPTVDDAMRDARKMNVDPLRYAAPAMISNEYRDRFGTQEGKDTLLSPDDAQFSDILTDKVDYGNGITVYDVQDDAEGQDAVRTLMNDHLGKDFNCWCLLYADAQGNITPSARNNYWKHYNSIPKRVAFKDGRICSFCASDNGRTEWWDLSDRSHGNAIPIEMEIPGDAYNRRTLHEFNEKTRKFSRVKDSPIFRGNKKNGRYEEWYDLNPHSLAKRENYKSGKLEGLSEEWYRNGQLKRRDHYKDDELDGLIEEWHENGQLEFRAIYKDSKPDGLSESWHYNGQPEFRSNFKDGKLEGINESWHENGQIKFRAYYKDGKLDGLYEEWHYNGQLKLRAIYKDGKRNGLSEEWNEDGQLFESINYKDGKLDGLYELWHDNGQPKERKNYKDGKLDGLRELWHDNGQPLARSNFKDGEIDGIGESWYENGQIQSRTYYKDGKREGLHEEWYYNGQPKERSTHKDDLLDGLCELWRENGQLAFRTIYKDGQLFKALPINPDTRFRSIRPDESLLDYARQAAKATTRFRTDMETDYIVYKEGDIHSVINLLDNEETEQFFIVGNHYDKDIVEKFNKWLSAHKNDFVRLYHGTNSNNDIIGQGIKKTTAKRRNSYQSESGYVYLSIYPGMARAFGEIASPYHGATVYSVDIQIKDLKPDTDQLNNTRIANSDDLADLGNTLAESLIYAHGARVKRSISPSEVNNTRFRKAQPTLPALSPSSAYTQATTSLENIEQGMADYQQLIDEARAQLIDAITIHPDDSPRTMAEKTRLRKITPQFLHRDNATIEQLLQLGDVFTHAMNANDKAHKGTGFIEAFYDSMRRLDNLIADMRRNGAVIDDNFNPWLTQNQAKSRAQAASHVFDLLYKNRLLHAIARCIRKYDRNNANNAETLETYEILSLYVQAKTALERQAVKEALAMKEAEEKGEEYKPHDFAGRAGIQYAIFGLHEAIDEDVEKIKNNFDKLSALAQEKEIPTIEQFVADVESKAREEIDELWDVIRSISEHNLATSFNAGITSRTGYQVLTYGTSIDAILREKMKMQEDAIKNNPDNYDSITEYDKEGNATGTRQTLNSVAVDALRKLRLEYEEALKAVPMPGTRNNSFEELRQKGWLTRAEIESFHRYYEFYLPLKGHAELTAADVNDYEFRKPRNQSKIKAVEGHTQLAQDPFKQLIQDSHGTIQSAEQNRWRQHLYNILAANDMPEQYAIQQRYYKVQIDQHGNQELIPYGEVRNINGVEIFVPGIPTDEEIKLGTAVSYSNRRTQAKVDIPIRQAQREEHTMTVFVNGEPYTVFFYDKRIADAVNGKNIKQINLAWLQRFQALNRLYAGLKTSLNPTFTLVSNLWRDWVEMTSNNLIEHGATHAFSSFINRFRATMAGDIQQALRLYQRGELVTMEDAETETERYVMEFILNGGQVNITQLPDYDVVKQSIEKELTHLVKTGEIKEEWWLSKAFNNMAERVELAPRLATYIASRKIGRPITQAINDAKEATVNFDRKGTWSGYMGLMSLFFNAAAQGVRRQVSLARRHPARFFTTYAVIGMMAPITNILISQLFSWMLGDDDDDFERICKDYFATSPELRRNYNIIMLGDTYIRIPRPVNYLPYVTFGDVIADYLLNPNHRNDALKDVLDITSAILDTFTPTMIAQPIGFAFDAITAKDSEERANALLASGFSIANKLPILEPLLQGLGNYNFMGGTLYDMPFDRDSIEPAYQRARTYTQPIWVWTSEMLNDISGGNDFSRGNIDIAPEIIENAFTIFGGFGEYGENIASLSLDAYKFATGQEVDIDDVLKAVPLVSRVYGGNREERADKAMQSLFYDDMGALSRYEQYRKEASAENYDKVVKRYSTDERKYYADLATMEAIARRVRKYEKPANEDNPRWYEHPALKDLYQLADAQFHALSSGNYTPVDDTYYIYRRAVDFIENTPVLTADGTYNFVDFSGVLNERKPKDESTHINISQLPKDVAERYTKLYNYCELMNDIFNAVSPHYYPGMPLSEDERKAFKNVSKESEKISNLIKDIIK